MVLERLWRELWEGLMLRVEHFRRLAGLGGGSVGVRVSFGRLSDWERSGKRGKDETIGCVVMSVGRIECVNWVERDEQMSAVIQPNCLNLKHGGETDHRDANQLEQPFTQIPLVVGIDPSSATSRTPTHYI